MKELMKKTRERMDKSIEAVRNEFASIRTGRASAALLDGIMVECYGSRMPINQVATIGVPEARLIVVTPFDKSVIGNINKALLKSDLGLTPIVDSNLIRLPIPPLTEERRKNVVKTLHRIAEEGKVAVRNIRRDANDAIKKAQKNGDTSEDEAHHYLDEIQKLTDKHIEMIKELLKIKEKDVMEG
ncbi:MAG: ribosome recycling factor [Candidatus Hydrogenedentes bacterium]|nr:ribosome recycling factor [Candidatus Hydrogenedentota bacterium]